MQCLLLLSLSLQEQLDYNVAKAVHVDPVYLDLIPAISTISPCTIHIMCTIYLCVGPYTICSIVHTHTLTLTLTHIYTHRYTYVYTYLCAHVVHIVCMRKCLA